MPSPEFAGWLQYAAANRERLQLKMPGQSPVSVTSTLALHFGALSEEEREGWARAAQAAARKAEEEQQGAKAMSGLKL